MMVTHSDRNSTSACIHPLHISPRCVESCREATCLNVKRVGPTSPTDKGQRLMIVTITLYGQKKVKGIIIYCKRQFYW